MANSITVTVYVACIWLCFSGEALCSTPEGRAEIVVQQALVPRETGIFAGSRDAYAKLYVDGSYLGRTKVIDDTHTPAWNETFYTGPIRSDAKIRIALWDKDYLSADDYMGSTTVTPREVLDKNLNNTHYVREFPHGFIQFKLTWYPCKNNVCF
ncbi:extended synaptotagmin-1-like isoform X2 [Dinothrombium tinctorium]|uniref:Extended synaptotagmin-1-like isoform X2 n=1 Tax=Dinothrombium tinctorium TaxID=1965070 RepID=A0A3S3PBE8_9ACAR|nr:extended synaptotagmin-1-like isoform X2 [Dinothrombium tinctorium]